jgi:uncharacterized protein
VAAAREDGADAVVTVGLSMGGGAALRQAALGRRRPDAVVSVSAVSRIAPTPLLLVHGHAESGATAPLVERIGRWASATING